jgi:AP-4 complex subunit sigma-1
VEWSPLAVGVDAEENELAIFEFIHCVVETLDRHFGNVCELDIMFHLDKAHYILDEMVMNGAVVETNKAIILQLATQYVRSGEEAN